MDAAEDAAASMSDPAPLLTVDDLLNDTADLRGDTVATQASKPGVSKLLVGAGIVLAGIVVIRLIK